jgi:hypothetical protein
MKQVNAYLKSYKMALTHDVFNIHAAISPLLVLTIPHGSIP